MRRTRLRGVTLGVVALAAVEAATEPFAALSPLGGVIGQSTTIELIESLNGKLLYVAVPVTILVEGILIYTVLKFKDSKQAQPTKENRRLEITWTVATAVVLLFVGVASIGVLANDSVTYTGGEIESDGVEVTAEAFQWNWNMSYPNEGITELTASDLTIDAGDASGPVIVLPVDRPIYITVTTQDVLHALHVPNLGLKQDAVPGQENTIKTTITETGVYQGYCAEYCGAGHSRMYFEVVVVTNETYQQFLDNQTAEADTGASVATNATVATNETTTPTGNETVTPTGNGTVTPTATPTGNTTATSDVRAARFAG